jgi:ribokinase
MAKIVVVGSLNMDIVAVASRLPIAGETLIGSRYLNVPGGKGANQAYAASKLGGDVAMLGRVGTDDHGRKMRANLQAVGCDVENLKAVEGNSGVAVIFVAESGENSIVVVPGANHRYLRSDFQADVRSLAGAHFVLLQLEIPMETVVAAAQAAKSSGARVILDPAPAPESLPLELLRNVDILTPNETEAVQLVGASVRHVSRNEARDIARLLQNSGPKTVIIKLGAQGCLLADSDVVTVIPAPVVDAVDATAAGDVFNAALAVACLEGATLIEACRFAVHAAALSVTRFGAQQSVPSRAETDAFCRVNEFRVGTSPDGNDGRSG